MHATVIRDGQLYWEERDDPVPGDTEFSWPCRRPGSTRPTSCSEPASTRRLRAGPPDIPGMELAGEVVAVGRAVTAFAPGDRVMALVGGGAQATMAFVDESHALAVPDSLPWPEAGGFPEAFSTAYDALFTQAALAMGERVLVSGAAGGVGTAGVQLAARSRRHRDGDGAPRRAPPGRGRLGRRTWSSLPARRATTAPTTSSSSSWGRPA